MKRTQFFLYVIAGMLAVFGLGRLLVGWWVGNLVSLMPVSDFVLWSRLDAGFLLAVAFLVGFLPCFVWWVFSTVFWVMRR